LINLFHGLLRSIGLLKNYCPVCGQDKATFLPLPDYFREQATLHGYERFGKGEMISLDSFSCSVCGASDRERIYAYWIDAMICSGTFKKGRFAYSFCS